MRLTRNTFSTLRPQGLHLNGTDQADTLNGSAYGDTIHARGGDDTVHGGGGNDLIYGEAGNDQLFGDAGNDTLDGGDGNDSLEGGAGADTLIGGNGTDTVSYANGTIGVMLDLTTGGITNDAAGDTYSGIENVTGSAYGDIINGNQLANVIHGGNGEDFLFGQGGDDRIFGDAGNDNLRGGAGNDRLEGGYGEDRLTGDDAGSFGYDTFVMAPNAFSNGDIITDFQHGYDRIDVSAFASAGQPLLGSDGRLAIGPCHVMGGLGGAPADENAVWTNGALEANDQFVFNPEDSTLYAVHTQWSDQHQGYYVDFARAVATLEGVTDLSASDLILSDFHLPDLTAFNFTSYATLDPLA